MIKHHNHIFVSGIDLCPLVDNCPISIPPCHSCLLKCDFKLDSSSGVRLCEVFINTGFCLPLKGLERGSFPIMAPYCHYYSKHMSHCFVFDLIS